MSKFEALFGFKSSEIKKNCILMPFIPKGTLKNLGMDQLKKGCLYASLNSQNFTIIHTGMGAPLVGDAVLHLKSTPCQNIILFGGCGAVSSEQGLSIGSLVFPEKSLSYECFSDLLLENILPPKISSPDKKFSEDFLKFAAPSGLQTVTCATMGSLKLEEERQDWLLKQSVHVVDMECSAFFSAATFSHLSALTLFFVTDILKSKPFYIKHSENEQKELLLSIEKALNLLCQFFSS